MSKKSDKQLLQEKVNKTFKTKNKKIFLSLSQYDYFLLLTVLHRYNFRLIEFLEYCLKGMLDKNKTLIEFLNVQIPEEKKEDFKRVQRKTLVEEEEMNIETTMFFDDELTEEEKEDIFILLDREF